jgi:hypothetical protein
MGGWLSRGRISRGRRALVLACLVAALLAPNASADTVSSTVETADERANWAGWDLETVEESYDCVIEASGPTWYGWWESPSSYRQFAYLYGGDSGTVAGATPTCVHDDAGGGRPDDTHGDNTGVVPLRLFQLPVEFTRSAPAEGHTCRGNRNQTLTGTTYVELPELSLWTQFELATIDGSAWSLRLTGWTDDRWVSGIGLVTLESADSLSSACHAEFDQRITMRGSLDLTVRDESRYGEVVMPPSGPCPYSEPWLGNGCLSDPEYGDPPVNRRPPQIYGGGREGDILTASTGEWSDPKPLLYRYRWQRAPSWAGPWTDIAGGDGAHYRATPDDRDMAVRVIVTATTANGAADAASPEMWISAAPARNVVPPRVVGVSRRGQTVSAEPGAWVGTGPFEFSYQWQRCTRDEACSDIVWETASTYRLREDDVGLHVRVRVSSWGPGGGDWVTSELSAYVAGAPDSPVNLDPPTIGGRAQVGEALTAGNGRWRGDDPMVYTYDWRRCESDGASCVGIPGPHTASYRPSEADVGHALKLRVVARNAEGAGEATSAATAPVTADPEAAEQDSDGGAPPGGWPPSDGSPIGALTSPGGMGIDPLAPGKEEPVAATQQPASGQMPVFDTTTPGGGYFLPPVGPPPWYEPRRFQQTGYPSQVSVAVGDGRVYVVGRSAYYAYFDAKTLAYLGTFEGDPSEDEDWSDKGCSGTAAAGVSYYEGEVYVADRCSGRVLIYDRDGRYRRQFETSPSVRTRGLGDWLSWLYPAGVHTPVPRGVASGIRPAGIDVAWGEVWVQLELSGQCERTSASRSGGSWDTPPPACSMIGVYDAATGAMKGLLPHLPRYGCTPGSTGTAGTTTGCAAAADAARATEEETRRLDLENQTDADSDHPRQGTQKYGYFDLAAAPELSGVFGQCRLIRRNATLAALSTTDMLTPDSSGDCPQSRHLEGIDAVWGMNWLLAASGDPGAWSRTDWSGTHDYSGHPGRWISEYDTRPLAGTYYSEYPMRLARRWQPKDAASENFRDVAYNNRETRIDWVGPLTEDKWLRGTKCLDYIVSDADIYVIGWRGERWYEPARNFEEIEFKLDGKSFKPRKVSTSATSPPSLCIDPATDRLDDGSAQGAPITSDEYRLDAVARVAGKTVTATNEHLRLDNTAPAGTVSGVPQYAKDTVTITGTITDAHSGPGSWQVELQRAGDAWTPLCPAATRNYTCEWNTANGQYPDGAYKLRGKLTDRSSDGGNTGASAEITTIVDNAPPRIAEIIGPFRDHGSRKVPIYEEDRPSVHIAATDQGSGVTGIRLLVGEREIAVASRDCAGGGCGLTLDATFDSTLIEDGIHTVRVEARDALGHIVSDSWQIDVRRSLADTPDESDVDELNTAPDEEIDDGPEGPDTAADSAGMAGRSSGYEVACGSEDVVLWTHIDWGRHATLPIDAPVGHVSPSAAVAGFVLGSAFLPPIPVTDFQPEQATGSSAIYSITRDGDRQAVITVAEREPGVWLGEYFGGCSSLLSSYIGGIE